MAIRGWFSLAPPSRHLAPPYVRAQPWHDGLAAQSVVDGTVSAPDRRR